MCGGFVAGLLVLSVYYSWINNFENKDDIFSGAFGTLRASDNSLFSSILDQLYGSALLMFGIEMIPERRDVTLYFYTNSFSLMRDCHVTMIK